MTPSLPNQTCSKLMLGTVQFGLPYGVANRTGQPSYTEVRRIVETAFEGGIHCFDTAAAYGTSEQVLGQVLAELGLTEKVCVVTKVRPLQEAELADPHLAASAIEASIAASRRLLRMDCLPIVLFHRESDAIYLPVLKGLRDRGWLRACGVSCDHDPEPVAKFLLQSIDAVQLPGNLLDRRHLHSPVLASADQQGVKVFIRSVFLQGLLVMPEAEIPTALHAVIPIRQKLFALAASAGLTPAELALRYLLSFPSVTSVLIGVETVAQIRDNLALQARGPLPADLFTAVDAAIPHLPELCITPRLWPPRPS